MEASPRFKARMAGVFQLLEALTAASPRCSFSTGLSSLATPRLRRPISWDTRGYFGWGSHPRSIGVAFHIAWALLMYELLKPVNRTLSLLAAFVILVGCAIQALTSLFYLAPLLILQGSSSLSAFTAEQLQALALMFVKLRVYSFDIYLVFFGFWCILIGYLIFRSTFLPRILGVLVAISGLGWVTYLSPPLANHLWPYIAAASALGEIPLEFWLIVMGLNVQRWKEQASAAPNGV
jgi:hypothetical protein